MQDTVKLKLISALMSFAALILGALGYYRGAALVMGSALVWALLAIAESKN